MFWYLCRVQKQASKAILTRNSTRNNEVLWRSCFSSSWNRMFIMIIFSLVRANHGTLFKNLCHFILDTNSWEREPEAPRLSSLFTCLTQTLTTVAKHFCFGVYSVNYVPFEFVSFKQMSDSSFFQGLLDRKNSKKRTCALRVDISWEKNVFLHSVKIKTTLLNMIFECNFLLIL